MGQVVGQACPPTRPGRAGARSPSGWDSKPPIAPSPGFDVTEMGTEKRLALWVVRRPEDVEPLATLGSRSHSHPGSTPRPLRRS